MINIPIKIKLKSLKIKRYKIQNILKSLMQGNKHTFHIIMARLVFGAEHIDFLPNILN